MKNPTFLKRFFAESLGTIGRLARSEFDVDDESLVRLRAFFEAWQEELTAES